MTRCWKFGFTLIELLIVVAIIAILAAIAVPNFLEAQMRAKVSKSYADFHAIATAFEAYRVDGNAYPPPAGPRVGNNPKWAQFWLDGVYQITTPIGYLTCTACTHDPFEKPANWPEIIHDDYGTNSYMHSNLHYMSALYILKNMEWMVMTFGPSRIQRAEGLPWGYIPYDPTNGTVSVGQIMYYGPASTNYFRYP